jgi:hypothetical protein
LFGVWRFSEERLMQSFERGIPCVYVCLDIYLHPLDSLSALGKSCEPSWPPRIQAGLKQPWNFDVLVSWGSCRRFSLSTIVLASCRGLSFEFMWLAAVTWKKAYFLFGGC